MQEDNPLYRFHYCPLCGSAHFVEKGDNARHCADCGFTLYTNPRGATVAVIINDQGEMLVARRAKEPSQGTRDLVGGFMDMDETAEEAMCREIREESGLIFAPDEIRYLFSQPNRYPYSGIVCRTIDLFFECRVKGRPAFKAMDDVSALQWIPIRDIRVEEFGLESIRKGLSRYLSSLDQ